MIEKRISDPSINEEGINDTGVEGQETIGDEEKCQIAIRVYQEALYESREMNLSNDESIQHQIEGYVRHNSSYLASRRGGSEGLRIGAPKYHHTKLRYSFMPPDYSEKYFHISANGLDNESFQQWQKKVGEKFEAEGLKFYYFN